MGIDWKATAGETDHRPWPAPVRTPAMTMSWVDLLLAHWPADPDVIDSTLPEGLEVDTWEGRAWLTVVPFEMANTGSSAVRGSWSKVRFAELNLRTYVTAGGAKPGVWFYSLDAASRFAVLGARAFFSLPYYLADIEIDRHRGDEAIAYASRRLDSSGFDARFAAGYVATGPAERTDRGSFEEWLTRRYCLYSADRQGHVYRADVQHRPWRLADVEVEIAVNELDLGWPFDIEGPPELAQYSPGLHVLGWWPVLVTGDHPAGS